MKRITFLLAAFLMVGSVFAQKAPTTKLISNSEEEIVVSFQLNGYTTSKVQTPQGEQFVVNVPKMASILEAGAPDLPMFPISAIIGDQAEMTVNVIDAQYTDYANVEVAPSKGNFSRQINPEDVPYTYGPMYEQDAFWPATQAYLEKPYILRDFRGQNIMVRPFAYNPVTKTLRVYTSLTIAMTKVSDNGENQKVSRKSNTIKVDPERKAQYDRRFINFGEATAKYPFDEDFGELLIICPDQYMSMMDEFVAWKNMSGRPTTLVSITEAGGNNDNAIKNYISNFYNDPNHNLEFILLIGEYNDLTPHSMTGGRSDNWFGQLEGSDYYLEALTGRFSVQNATQLQTHINKVLFYERDVQAGITWGNRGMGIGYYGAGSGHYGEDDYYHIDLIRDTLLHYTYQTVTEHHGGSGGDASVSTISGTTNEGISIINYCNHGSPTSWGVADYSVSNVNALTNDYKLPIVWSVACQNGQFDVGECFGEAWLRATNNSTSAPTGAIGGMFSWISQPWVPPMYGQDEMVDILTEWIQPDHFHHTLGGCSLNGSMKILDAAPSDNGSTHCTWLLFGDPSLMVRTDNPTTMNVTTSPSVLMVGMEELNISADADYAIATLSMDGEVIATCNIINGQGALTFDPLTSVGEADLVITGYNKVTYLGTVDVIVAEGAYITIGEYELSEAANYGETIDMSLDIRNVGVETANNLVVTISTDNEFVNITENEGTIASINPDETISVEGFQFEIAENVPDGTTAQLDVNITDGTDTWTGKVMINMHAPIVVLESLNVEEASASFTFKNNGSAPFYGGTFSITSCSPDLVFDQEAITFEDVVEGGQNITLSIGYTVAETVEPGTTFEASYAMNTGLFEISDIFVISYGAIMEDFESGSFGENWTVSASYPWQVVTGGRGNFCAKSNNNGQHNSSGYMQLTVDVLAAGELTFMYKVSSENNYDKLHFYMDGQEKGVWSGTVNWTQFTQAVTPGQHTFKWEYTKDTSVSSGEDCAWVDDILFPPTNVITFLAPASDLEAEVSGHDVRLTWTASPDADSYVVKRDGVTIETVTETTFAETLSEGGFYTYSVIAMSGGSSSVPATVTIEINTVGLDENEASVNIYPNPVNNTLFIQSEAEFSFTMYNGMGQVVANGNAQGTQKINVSNMSKGVYFVRITSGTQTMVQKVVVE